MRLWCTASRSYLYHYFYNVVLAGFVNSAQINEFNTIIKSDFKEDSGIRPDFHFSNALVVHVCESVSYLVLPDM